MQSKDMVTEATGRGHAELQRQIDDLRQIVGNVAQATVLENVVQHGFERLSNQLEPLRDLGPERAFPSSVEAQKLAEILRAIRHPKWRNSDFTADVPKSDDNCNRSGKS